jgi:hypothetical protein
VIGYLDTVAAGVSRSGNLSSFVFEMAEEIPDPLQIPVGSDAAAWSFCLDTDPSSAAPGYPYAPAVGRSPASSC